ncbi:hypothetical protein [Haloferula rosea]|uniref:Uncharacterized protein n=1 Tax=Haloferula rosea TaxID=490093 RepID=A0A934RDZ6_9BACT|nr:hypothetical protein [Haloferula rosea]MBK1827802.1 hypothetical protein [Haloferula rosea]
MRNSLLISLMLILAVTASDLGKLQDSFMTRYDAVNQERDAALEKLTASYLGALERHMQKVKAGGDLEQVLPVRDEINAVKQDAAALPELPHSVGRQLRSMRTKFSAARATIVQIHAKSLVDLADKMNAALAKEESELTKDGKIDEALSAKRMRETLSMDAGIAAARSSQKAEKAAMGRVEWINLVDGRITPMGRATYLGRIGGEGYEKLHEKMRARFEEIDDGEGQLFVALAPVAFELNFPQPVSKLEAKGFAANRGGRAKFEVEARGVTVVSKEVDADEDPTVRLDCEFEPTKRLLIRVDRIGKTGIWTALLDGRVR